MAFSLLAKQRWGLALCFVGMLGMMPTPRAQGQSLAEARTLFERGNRELQRAQSQRGARKKASLQLALDAYVESLRIARNRNVLFNTAVALEGLDRDTEAYNYYQEFLQFEDLKEDKRERAQKQLEHLTQRVGIVNIETEPAGASVRIGRADTPSLGNTPLSIAVEPRTETTLLLAKKGYRGTQKKVTLERGTSGRVRAQLELLEVPLIVHAPGMVVELDGKRIEEGEAVMLLPGKHKLRVNMGRIERSLDVAPGEPMTVDLRGTSVRAAPASFSLRAPVAVIAELDGAVVARNKKTFSFDTEAGRHRLRLQAPGFAPAEAAFSLSAGQQQTVAVSRDDIELEQTKLEPWPTVSWIATGVAAAGTAALQLNYWLSYQDNQDAPDDQSIFDQAEDARLWGNIALGATAALGITALVLTLLDEHEVEPALRIRIGAAPVQGGAVISGGVTP